MLHLHDQTKIKDVFKIVQAFFVTCIFISTIFWYVENDDNEWRQSKFQLQTQTVHTSFTNDKALAQLLDHRQNRYKTDMLQYFRANCGTKTVNSTASSLNLLNRDLPALFSSVVPATEKGEEWKKRRKKVSFALRSIVIPSLSSLKGSVSHH